MIRKKRCWAMGERSYRPGGPLPPSPSFINPWSILRFKEFRLLLTTSGGLNSSLQDTTHCSEIMPASVLKDESKAFPYWQLTVLALCRFSEPIAFSSILSYSYVMTIDLLGGTEEDDKDASFYSGLLVSAYAVAEALTSVGWGTLSDHYGRKPVVLIGLGGVALSSLIFGFSQKYWVALLARFIGGALNGNVSVMQTMVAEMVKVPEHEPAAYAVQPFVWTLGSIVGAALGGFLAQPAKSYPHLFPEDGLFGRYPYLLPNLLAVLVVVLAIIQGLIFLDETNPRAKYLAEQKKWKQQQKTNGHNGHTETSPLLQESTSDAPIKRPSVDGPRPFFVEESLPAPGVQTFDLRRSSFGTMHEIDVPHNRDGPSERTQSQEPEMHYEGAPLKPHGQLDLIGGFGYSLPDVGVYLMVNGILSLGVQAFIFPLFVSKVGVWRSFIIVVILYPTAYLVMPFLSAVPNFTSAGIIGSLLLQAFFGIISVPAALILLKDATPSPLVLGRVNGLAMSACCAARTVSPPMVGLLYSAGGSAVAWFSCALVGVLGALQLFWIPRKEIPHVSIERPTIVTRDDDDDATVVQDDEP
ncbi:hypothetical protein BN1708_001552 [Verticillium longisporum]|uniref:Major facilitator superfamily (MFS) profile domain-containing protein n=1 Tax=Verticillium longisporum TaxID=100787 RepID=A0A0G4MYL8_VERLO|nr:hypothetical protein BN1708_001552 [Verticillium longisporum]